MLYRMVVYNRKHISLVDDEFLDNKPHWYNLHEHDENNTAKLPKPRILSPRSTSPARSAHSSRSLSTEPRSNGKSRSRSRASSLGPGNDRRSSPHRSPRRSPHRSPHRHRDNHYLSVGVFLFSPYSIKTQ